MINGGGLGGGGKGRAYVKFIVLAREAIEEEVAIDLYVKCMLVFGVVK